MTHIPGKTIAVESLHQKFANITEKTDWDVSSNLLWGYFFTHSEPLKLESAKNELIENG